ncbi:uncharacterized protein [Myotis yumanensis]|uniref:uncharacterized protein n=1 Tax=Myotis yumanensis TaxID=159337 RepID=UPI0038D16474
MYSYIFRAARVIEARHSAGRWVQFCAGREQRRRAAGGGPTKGRLSPGGRGARRGRLVRGPGHGLETPGWGPFTDPPPSPGAGRLGRQPLRRPWAVSKRRHLDSPNLWCGGSRCSPVLTSLFVPSVGQFPWRPGPGENVLRQRTGSGEQLKPDSLEPEDAARQLRAGPGRAGPGRLPGDRKASALEGQCAPQTEMRGCSHSPGLLGCRGRHPALRPLRRLLGRSWLTSLFDATAAQAQADRRCGAGRASPSGPRRIPEGFSVEAGSKGLTASLPHRALHAGRRPPPPAPPPPPPEVSLGEPSPLFSTFPQSSAFK